jgi:hypothetical protein
MAVTAAGMEEVAATAGAVMVVQELVWLALLLLLRLQVPGSPGKQLLPTSGLTLVQLLRAAAVAVNHRRPKERQLGSTLIGQ